MVRIPYFLIPNSIPISVLKTWTVLTRVSTFSSLLEKNINIIIVIIIINIIIIIIIIIVIILLLLLFQILVYTDMY